jgi:type IV pilus assembly protein PilB
MRSLVRQDPDIIMVGEIRDKETASLAINAALTGHLVLSTLHTNTAAGAIPRLSTWESSRFFCFDVRVIIGQRLVRKLTSDKEKYDLSRDEQAQLERIVDAGNVLRALKEEKVVPKDSTWKDISFYHPHSSQTSPTGFSGRIGIYEVMPVTSPP